MTLNACEAEVDERADGIVDRRQASLHYVRWWWAAAVARARLLRPLVDDPLFSPHDELRFHAELPDGCWWEGSADEMVVRSVLADYEALDEVPAVLARGSRPRWLGLKKAAKDLVDITADRMESDRRRSDGGGQAKAGR